MFLAMTAVAFVGMLIIVLSCLGLDMAVSSYPVPGGLEKAALGRGGVSPDICMLWLL